MTSPQLEFPEGFDDFAWEAEAKGWLPGVRVRVGDRAYTLTFYDPVRLAQDLEEALEQRVVFAERNLLVLKEVTRANIVAAVAEIAANGGWSDLTPDADEMGT